MIDKNSDITYEIVNQDGHTSHIHFIENATHKIFKTQDYLYPWKKLNCSRYAFENFHQRTTSNKSAKT